MPGKVLFNEFNPPVTLFSHDFTLASEAGIECRVLGIFADAAQDNRVTNNTRPVGIMVSGYDPKLPEIILRAMDMLLKFRLHNMDILGQLINQLQGAYQGVIKGSRSITNHFIRHHDWRSSPCMFRVGHTSAHQQLLFFARKT